MLELSAETVTVLQHGRQAQSIIVIQILILMCQKTVRRAHKDYRKCSPPQAHEGFSFSISLWQMVVYSYLSRVSKQ